MTHVTILTRAGQGPRPYIGLRLNGHFSFLGKLSGVDADKLRRLVWYPKAQREARCVGLVRSGKTTGAVMRDDGGRDDSRPYDTGTLRGRGS